MSPEYYRLLEAEEAVIIDSHVVYTARGNKTAPDGEGDHGSAYIQKDAAFKNPDTVDRFCGGLALLMANLAIEVLVVPRGGAINLLQGTAQYLKKMTGKKILTVYADEAEGKHFVLKRGYDKHVKNKRCAVIDDILNSGGSAAEVVEAVRRAEGRVVGVFALANRGGVTAEKLGVPFVGALVNVTLEKWPAEECPLCHDPARKRPVNTTVGHGAAFLAKQKK